MRSRTVLLLGAVLAAVLALGTASVPMARVASGPGSYPGNQPMVPDAYFPADGNPGFALQSYDLRIRYRFSDGHLRGTAKMLLFSHRHLPTFTLDLLLDVDSVSFIDHAGDEPVEAEFRRINKHEVEVTPARPIPNGDPGYLVVEYHGYPGRISWRGESNWLANRHEVVTMGEPHMAPWWFPTNEHPSDPASFDIRVTTASRMQVISNGDFVSRTVHGPTATTRWQLGGSMAPYLAYFAAGDFDIERGRSASGLTYYNAVSKRLGQAARTASMRTLRRSARVVEWFDREVGPYYYDSTGGVVTSLRPGFAVGNMTRPTYPARPSDRRIVHELAHHWFGGALRPTQWADVWLSEGFATYVGWLYDEAHGGPHTDRRLERAFRTYRGRARFWDLTVSDPGPERLYDTRVAIRGAMTLAALRHRFGPRRFDDLLRAWVGWRYGRHSSSLVFELFSEKELRVELDDFFEAWLRDHRPPPRRAQYGL